MLLGLRRLAARNCCRDVSFLSTGRLVKQSRPSCRFLSATRRMTDAAAAASPSSSQAPESSIVDLAWPYPAWTDESRKLFEELYSCDDLAYVKHEVDVTSTENRLFTRNDRERTGRFFNYAMFFNKAKQQLCGVVQFGPYTQGPTDCVHGGASATMCDSIMGKLIGMLGHRSLTANLSIDYKSVLLINATYYFEGFIEKMEGRKIFTSCRITSTDRQSVYVAGRALFLTMGSSDIEEVSVKASQDKSKL